MEVNTSLYSSSNVSSNSGTNQTNTSTSTTNNIANNTASNTQANTATDSYVSSSSTQVKGLYNKPQKLTDKQIKALKEAQAENQKQLIKKLTESLFLGQSGTSKSSSAQNSFDSLSNLLAKLSEATGLPEIVTAPEEAEKALTGDGPYSINSVTTRIMDMATSLAGNNPEKLELMRSAVKKGFEHAGITFSQITGESNLPQICQDTYDEVMKRFDELQEKYATTESNNTL